MITTIASMDVPAKNRMTFRYHTRASGPAGAAVASFGCMRDPPPGGRKQEERARLKAGARIASSGRDLGRFDEFRDQRIFFRPLAEDWLDLGPHGWQIFQGGELHAFLLQVVARRKVLVLRIVHRGLDGFLA